MVKKSDGEIIAEGLSELAEAMEKGLADAILKSGDNISASDGKASIEYVR